MDDLFTQPDNKGYVPLAERLRPRSLDDILGQDHLLGPGAPLRKFVSAGSLPSMILWGPPGSGKTTIARVLANTIDAHFFSLSAVLSGIKEVREVIETAQRQRRISEKKTVLFIDEIHRFNKAQQDAFLPHVESGVITLIGATTENPSFEVISPLLSRAKVYVLNPISEKGLERIIEKAIQDKERGLGSLKLKPDKGALEFIVQTSDGDARRALNTIEIAASLAAKDRKITTALIESAMQKKSLLYDKLGEEHYNIISAFIKSMRGSSPDAALYWMARMLEAGEDPLFIARRMVIFASEDIGNADPQAIQVAISCQQSLDFVGMPEGWIPLAQSATYLATAPKSKSAYYAYQKAKADVEEHGVLPVPLHIRNAPTKLMKDLHYGEDYKNPQKCKGNFVKQQYLPDKLAGKVYYEPTENGYERHISERLKNWR